MKLTLKRNTLNEFFDSGRSIAKKIDQGKLLTDSSEKIIHFDELEDMLGILTPARLKLIRETKIASDSISGLAKRLHRDRRAIARDIAALDMAGVLSVSKKILPGHGSQKWIQVVAASMKVEAYM